MKVGVLGHSGFVGINLMEMLEAEGIECCGASRRSGVDASRIDSIKDWIRQNDITHVVNLAAIAGGIGLNKERPADLWEATQTITTAVLLACSTSDISKLVMTGTVCSYAADARTPFKEEYLMKYGEPEPTNRAYGLAKLSSLYGARAFHDQYGLNVCCLIPVNMYGRHDHFDLKNSHVIPAIIRKITDAKNDNDDVMLWGTGSPTREFLHATDFCRAVVLAIKSEKKETCDGTFINVGTGSEISIGNLADMISKLMSFRGRILFDPTKPSGQLRRCLDISRARDILGYRPKMDLRAGLADTIDWYLENQE